MTLLGVPSPEEIRGRANWFIAFGVILAILGVIALVNVVDATIVTTIFVGFTLLFGGIVQIIGAFMGSASAGSRILRIVLGVLYAIVGFDLVADPISGTITLTIAVAILLLAVGVLRLYEAFTTTGHRLLLSVIGVLSILLGIWLWTNIPVSGVAIGFFVGFELVMAGITWIWLGWMARSAAGAASSAPA
jgi:uncharacterized membrane protein HdeD (DUF308 family)